MGGENIEGDRELPIARIYDDNVLDPGHRDVADDLIDQISAEVVAHAAGIPVEQVGRLRAQAPVKPLLMDAKEVQA